MPKCKYCEKPVDTKTGYLFTGITKNGNPKREWYCSKEECEQKYHNQEMKDAVYTELRKYFPMVTRASNLPRILYADLNGVANVHGWEGILKYLQSDAEYLCEIMEQEFSSYNSKALYLLKVIMNRIEKEKVVQPKPVIIKQIEEFTMVEPVVQPKKKTPQRRGFDDLLEDL